MMRGKAGIPGCHAPGHFRECFNAAAEAFLDREEDPEPVVEYEVNYEPHAIPISRACKFC